MTISFGGWVLPLIVSLGGSIFIWLDSRDYNGRDILGIGAAMEFMGYVAAWGIPWGMYGIARAIFG